MSKEKIGDCVVEGAPDEAVGIEIEKDSQGYFYSYDMIFDLPISEHAKILYLFLCRTAGREANGGQDKNISFPSYQTIADACGFSRRTAIRTMKELMQVGLLIKKRQGNGNKQFTNKYMIFAEPKTDLKSKNKKQIDREEEEFRERFQNSAEANISQPDDKDTPSSCDEEVLPSDRETLPSGDRELLPSDRETLPSGDRETLPSGDRESLPSVRESLPSDRESLPSDRESLPSDRESLPSGDRESLPSDRETLPSVRESLEVLHIKGIHIKGILSSSSLTAEIPDEPQELVKLVEKVYLSVLDSTENSLTINNTKLPLDKIKSVYCSLNAVHFRQVIAYIKKSGISNINAIKTALYNSPEYVLLGQYGGGRKKIEERGSGNKFNNFPQRNYDYDDLEKKLLNRQKRQNGSTGSGP